MKYWEILLANWRNLGNNGLSIPFIIGSQNYLHNPPNHSIQDLFYDIAGSQDSLVFLMYCMNINDFVLVDLDDSKMRHGFFPTVNGQEQNRLLVSNFLIDLGSTLEDISDRLTEKLDNYIADGKYSINDGERGKFSREEIEFIARSFED